MKIDHKESYEDFGDQFLVDSNVDDYWGSDEMLQDIVHPLDLSSIEDKIVMEVGSGSGRIIKNLLKYNPKLIISVEPSEAINVAKLNNKHASHKISFKQIKCEELDLKNEVDFCFSLGVIHHIPNAEVAVRNIMNSLKINGRYCLWFYGYEGNEFYIFVFNNLRRVTRLLPDNSLRTICYILNIFCSFYISLCYILPLPLKDYLFNVFKKCSWEKRNYIIFDQLNPSYAKYYKKEDLNNLMEKCGVTNYEIFARHNYSWTVIGTKV